jgi:hypothetical protein
MRALGVGAVPLAELDEVARSGTGIVLRVNVELDVTVTASFGAGIVDAVFNSFCYCNTCPLWVCELENK